MKEALIHTIQALNGEGALSIDDVNALAEEYPYFSLPAAMLLRQEGTDLAPDLRQRLLHRIALNAPDAPSLMALLDADHPEWDGFYPPERGKAVTTTDVISTFLDTYGHADPKEDALLERLIFNPAPDYSTLLAMEEEESLPEPVQPGDTSQDALINAFILEQRQEEAPQAPPPPPESAKPSAPRAVPEDTSLSESLAKIYIRQKRFDKAFEIIHTLSLNNPKKSAYFADQLRFLRKLMLAREAKNAKKN